MSDIQAKRVLHDARMLEALTHGVILHVCDVLDARAEEAPEQLSNEVYAQAWSEALEIEERLQHLQKTLLKVAG